MTLEEFEKASREELRAKANELFDRADGAGPLDRPAYYSAAQFYLSEVKRREDDRLERRHLRLEVATFLLEVLIVLMIGYEIRLGIQSAREGRDQTLVLSNLQASSADTAKTLTALQRTTEAMGKAIQEQLAVTMAVHLTVSWTGPPFNILVANGSSSDVALMGGKFRGSHADMNPAPVWIAPGGSLAIPAESLFNHFAAAKRGSPEQELPYEIYCQNQDGLRYVVTVVFTGRVSDVGTVAIRARTASTVQRDWSK